MVRSWYLSSLATIGLAGMFEASKASPVTSLSRHDETLEFARSNDVAVFGIFDKETIKSRDVFHSVASSPEFVGAVSFADANNTGIFDWMRANNNFIPPVIVVVKSLDGVSVLEKAIKYSSVKSFIFQESLPSVVRLTPSSSSDSQRALTSFAFQQEVVSRFMVLTYGHLEEEVEEELTEFALHHKGGVVIFSIDFESEEAIGVALLEMAGLERDAVYEGMSRPVALMLGRKSSMVFSGFFERSPLEMFWADWKKAGEGGCTGEWESPSKDKKRKPKKKRNRNGITGDL
mmetsp:Transcript_53358/g.107066  ORF Transcript_53358/g.107066 Transcript_53358/m.107066 type:complete len:289 (-) Transcript_53358:145-1011(-)|eukprot:CAMPEP_0171710996 /NCGR_PEP_ID=MMETSP0991-20121206/16312_1 /TAXON_ID=483369 /ORGANISM="non described non described, Strain CCMP2098" /LENGTH=288 /DNA_ID=CAMNT_0012301213 /DNA_START=125 /DNA_END=991 /DNA_ORIENTATION=+